MSKTLRGVRNRIQLGSRFITPVPRKRNAREQVGVKAVTRAEAPFQRSRGYFLRHNFEFTDSLFLTEWIG